MICMSDVADDCTSVRFSRCSSVSGESSTRLVRPMMPFIGVRISWLMLARNSLLTRLAFSASRRASSTTYDWSCSCATSRRESRIALTSRSRSRSAVLAVSEM